jgi:hypothetical protein
MAWCKEVSPAAVMEYYSIIRNSIILTMFSKRPATARPHSSLSRRRDIRFNGNEELNSITANIHQTFNR